MLLPNNVAGAVGGGGRRTHISSNIKELSEDIFKKIKPFTIASYESGLILLVKLIPFGQKRVSFSISTVKFSLIFRHTETVEIAMIL